MDIDDTDLLGLAHCLLRGIEVGVLRTLGNSGESLTAVDLARELGIPTERLRHLLAVLEGGGVIREVESRWELTAGWQAIQSNWPAGADGAHTVWARLPEFLDGTPGPMASLEGAERHYQSTAPRMDRLYSRRASMLADWLANAGALGPDSGLILDVGSGSGVWSAEIAARSKQRRVLLDLPLVIANVRSDCGRVAGQATTLPIRGGVVQVLIAANVLHCLPDNEVRYALAEFDRVLGPNGLLVVVDTFPDLASRSLHLDLYALNLRIRGGCLHSAERLVELLPDGTKMDQTLPLDASAFIVAMVATHGRA